MNARLDDTISSNLAFRFQRFQPIFTIAHSTFPILHTALPYGNGG
jgi:hypothetical protein